MRIDSKTKLISLLGYPVGHSKSPLMHNTELERLGINAIYTAMEVEPKKLGEVVNGLKSINNFIGANVTIPHKENVMKYVDELTEEARNIGAVNTLYFKNGKLIGDNTDGRGFILSLMNNSEFDPKGKEVLVLGAGGAAKAIITKLIQESVKIINIYELNIEKSRELKKQLDKTNSSLEINLILKDELENYAKRSDLIINCTPVGLKETDPLILSESVFDEKKVVFDLIYNPEKTKLLIAAEKKGAKILNGLGMLVYQGALSFEKWIGENPNVKNMKEIIKKSIK